MSNMSDMLHKFKEDEIVIEIYDKDQGVPMGLYGKGIIYSLTPIDADELKWDIQLVSSEGTYHFTFLEDNVIVLRVNVS